MLGQSPANDGLTDVGRLPIHDGLTDVGTHSL